MTCDQLLDHAAEPAWVDGCGIELPMRVRPEEQADQHQGQIGIFGVTTATIGQPVEQTGQLGHDLGVQSGEAAAQLRAAERGDADLGEQYAAVAVGGELDEQEVEPALEGALRIQDVELGAQRRPQIFDHLVDGGDQQVSLGDEVVVHQAGGQARLGGDALHRGAGDAVLQDRRPQAVDDLTAARSGETRASHR